MLMLQAIDMLWVEHLEAMDYMRSSVRLRAYGQKDPLVEYKNEGRGLFIRMEASIDNAIAEMALKVGGEIREPKQEPVLEIHNSGPMIGKVSTNLSSSAAGSSKKKLGATTLAPAAAGRNIRNVTGRKIICYCVVLYFWYNAIKIVSGLLNKKFLILFGKNFGRRRKGARTVLQNFNFFDAVKS